MIPLMQAGPSRREGKRGGGGGNGLRVLQAGLSRYRRIRSTTRGSVMKETIFISAPHQQVRGPLQRFYGSTVPTMPCVAERTPPWYRAICRCRQPWDVAGVWLAAIGRGWRALTKGLRIMPSST